MDWTEVLGWATGALCVWLTVRRSVCNVPVGVANNLFFVGLRQWWRAREQAPPSLACMSGR